MKTKALFYLVFAAIVIIPVTTYAADPTAHATPTNVTAAGDTSYFFTVRYSDDGMIDTSSLGNGNVRVAGPNGFSAAAAFVSSISDNTGSHVTATYSVVPPGGSWDFADNGTYDLLMQPGQVTDGLGNPVAPGNIGSFIVMAPPGGPTPTPSPAQPLNISTRLRVQTGENVLIGGFIITGSAPKKVIIRAIGPSLINAGIADFLADPTLELHDATTTLATNDNWKIRSDGSSQQAEIEASTIPPTNDLESAIVRTLPANNAAYTVIVSGKNATTGVGLVEVYDLDQAADSKLANISTRGLVQTGSNVMIGGFILGGGSGNANVIVRAIGPSLIQAGISGALANPVLELHDGNGTLLRSNDNWKTRSDGSSQQAEIEGTGVAPQNDLESAIVANLPPGAFTAIVNGQNDATGVGLVEVYRLP